jgi:hypothetical protein
VSRLVRVRVRVATIKHLLKQPLNAVLIHGMVITYWLGIVLGLGLGIRVGLGLGFGLKLELGLRQCSTFFKQPLNAVLVCGMVSS